MLGIFPYAGINFFTYDTLKWLVCLLLLLLPLTARLTFLHRSSGTTRRSSNPEPAMSPHHLSRRLSVWPLALWLGP